MLNDSTQNFEGSKQKSPTNHKDENILQRQDKRSCISGFSLAAAILRKVTQFRFSQLLLSTEYLHVFLFSPLQLATFHISLWVLDFIIRNTSDLHNLKILDLFFQTFHKRDSAIMKSCNWTILSYKTVYGELYDGIHTNSATALYLLSWQIKA